MTIYTGRGDDGETDLRSSGRVSKHSPRIEAYGSVDELNAVLGTVTPSGYDDVDETVRRLQNHLHVLQADLANPESGPEDPTVEQRHVAAVEGVVDEFEADLPPLSAFVLPGGSDVGSTLHHARAVCRRAERRVVALSEADEVSQPAMVFLNRLSDALFTLARAVNHREGVPEENPDYDGSTGS